MHPCRCPRLAAPSLTAAAAAATAAAATTAATATAAPHHDRHATTLPPSRHHRERVEKLGIGDQCYIVEADICTAYDSKGKPADGLNLPAMGSIDIVTCSYCLTMIPPWKEALEQMVSVGNRNFTRQTHDFTITIQTRR